MNPLGRPRPSLAPRETIRTCRRQAGVTLVENLVGLGVGALVVMAVCGFSLFNARSFAGFSSYTTFDLANRKTTDQMTKDFRMCQSVTNFSASSIGLVDFDGATLQYTYNSTNQTLTRTKGTTNMTLLRDCTRLTFSMNLRNMTNGTFDYYPTTNIWECKAVTVNWCCSRKILGAATDDMPQTETVVIRN